MSGNGNVQQILEELRKQFGASASEADLLREAEALAEDNAVEDDSALLLREQEEQAQKERKRNADDDLADEMDGTFALIVGQKQDAYGAVADSMQHGLDALETTRAENETATEMRDEIDALAPGETLATEVDASGEVRLVNSDYEATVSSYEERESVVVDRLSIEDLRRAATGQIEYTVANEIELTERLQEDFASMQEHRASDVYSKFSRDAVERGDAVMARYQELLNPEQAELTAQAEAAEREAAAAAFDNEPPKDLTETLDPIGR